MGTLLDSGAIPLMARLQIRPSKYKPAVVKLVKDGHEDTVIPLYSLRTNDLIQCICVWVASSEYRVVHCNRVETAFESVVIKAFKYDVQQVEKYYAQDITPELMTADDTEGMKKRASLYSVPGGSPSKRRLIPRSTEDYDQVGKIQA